jgi:hypothetical protein
VAAVKTVARQLKISRVRAILHTALLTRAATQGVEQHAPPDQPCRDHLGVIEEEEIVCSQECRQIGDLPVFEPPRPRE